MNPMKEALDETKTLTDCINQISLHTPFYFDRKENNEIEIQNEGFKNKNVLVVGSYNLSRLTELLKLKSNYFKKFVCLVNEINFWASIYFDDTILAEHENLEEKELTFEKVQTYMSKNNIEFQAVVTFAEYSVSMTSYLCEKLNIKGIPFNYAAKMRNKYEFRTDCKMLGIPYTKFYKIAANDRVSYIKSLNSLLSSTHNEKDSSKDNIVKDMFGLQLPCILKLSFGFCKDFVRVCKTTSELLMHLESSVMEIEETHFCTADLILEEFYDGHEIDIDLLVKDNKVIFLSITDDLPQLPPIYLETGGRTPSYYLDSKEIEFIQKEIPSCIAKMNYCNAILHFEAKCKPKSLYGNDGYSKDGEINRDTFLIPIEINMRTGGVGAFSLIEATYGVNLLREYLSICFSLPIDEKKLMEKSSIQSIKNKYILKRYPTYKKKAIKSIKLNYEKLFNRKEIIEVNIFKTTNGKLSNTDFIGYMLVNANLNSTLQEENNLMTSISDTIQAEFHE